MKKFLEMFSINHFFSKVVIIFCVGYMAYVIERVLDIAEKTGVSHTPIITAAIVFFGGELFILAAKYAFADKTAAKLDEMRIKSGMVIPEKRVKGE